MSESGRFSRIRRRKGELSDDPRAKQRLVESLARDARVVQIISEEFRTPLTVGLGALKALGMKTEDPDLERIIASGSESLGMLHELVDAMLALSEAAALDVGSADRGKLHSLSLRDVQSRLRDHLSTLDTKGRIRYEGDGTITFAIAQPSLAVHALRFLLASALARSERGSAVTVGGSASADQRMLKVVDTGPPIPDATLGFARTGESEPLDRSFGTQGIVLYAANRAVQSLGGTLDFTHDGSGTTATITLTG